MTEIPRPPSRATTPETSDFRPNGVLVTQPYVVLVTPTIQDGMVVRWYVSEQACDRYDEFLSASRNRVVVNDAVIRSPDDMRALAEAIGVATAAMERLRSGRDEDRLKVNDLATHVRSFGSLHAVLRPVAAGGAS